MIFDFFKNKEKDNSKKILTPLSEFLNLDYKKLKTYLEENSGQQKYKNFIKEFNIDINNIKNSANKNNIKIICKHITTNSSSIKDIKKYGLMNLEKVLSLPTSLNKFLDKKNIVIDIENHIFKYKNKIEYLFKTKNKYGKELYKRIFYKNSGLEFFINGSDQELINYSNVRYYPEILFLIENIILDLYSEDIDLKKEWIKYNNNHYYILVFDVNFTDIRLNNEKNNKIESLITTVIDNYKYSGNQYGSLKKDKIIPTKNISITKEQKEVSY